MYCDTIWRLILGSWKMRTCLLCSTNKWIFDLYTVINRFFCTHVNPVSYFIPSFFSFLLKVQTSLHALKSIEVWSCYKHVAFNICKHNSWIMWKSFMPNCNGYCCYYLHRQQNYDCHFCYLKLHTVWIFL